MNADDYWADLATSRIPKPKEAPMKQGTGADGEIVDDCRARAASWATLSADGVYRYALGRSWAPGPECLWIMLNPSTADASKDDATIRRIRSFSSAWGFTGLVVVNLFAYRTAYPADLAVARDIKGIGYVVGPENDEAIRAVLKAAGRVVFAWGNSFGKLGWFKSRIAAVRQLVKAAGADPYCLGVTESGEPKHPVRLPGNTPLREWKGYR